MDVPNVTPARRNIVPWSAKFRAKAPKLGAPHLPLAAHRPDRCWKLAIEMGVPRFFACWMVPAYFHGWLSRATPMTKRKRSRGHPWRHMTTGGLGVALWQNGKLPLRIPSGDLTYSYWKMAIEIVDLPIKNGDFPRLCNSLPEGILMEVSQRK